MTWDDAVINFAKALECLNKPSLGQSFFSDKKDKKQYLAIEERALKGKQFLKNLKQFREAIEWILSVDTEDDLWIALLNTTTKKINHPAEVDRKQLLACLENINQKYEFSKDKTFNEMMGTVLLVTGSVGVIAFGLGIIGLMLASGPLGMVALGGIAAGSIIALVGAGLVIASALQLHKQAEFHKGNQSQEMKEFIDYLDPPHSFRNNSDAQITNNLTV